MNLVMSDAGIIGMGRKSRSGFTTIEALIVVGVLTLFISAGVAAFSGILDKKRLQAAAETLSSDMHFARSESMVRGPGNAVNLSFTTDGSTAWCYGLTTSASCDCSITDVSHADACVLSMSGTNVLRVVTAGDYNDSVSMSSVTFPSNTTGFDNTRGLATAGEAVLTADGMSANITLTALGRVRLCSSDNLGYPSC